MKTLSSLALLSIAMLLPQAALAADAAVELVAGRQSGANCDPVGRNATPVSENRFKPGSEALRLSAGGSLTLRFFGENFDQISDAPILLASSGGGLTAQLGSGRGTAAENRSLHCIERGSRDIEFRDSTATRFNQVGVSVFKLQLRLPGGRLSEVIKVERHPLPALNVELTGNENISIPCGSGLTGTLTASASLVSLKLPRGAAGEAGCAAGGQLRATQTLSLPATLGGRKYHFVLEGFQFYGATPATPFIGSAGDYNYASDPLGPSPTTVQWGTGSARQAHKDFSDKVKLTAVTGGVGSFEVAMDLDETPVFATGPVFSPRPPLRADQSFRVSFNIGSPNPSGQLITYRLSDAQCFIDGGASGYVPGLAFSTVTVPANSRTVSLNLRVSPEAVARGCINPPDRPHALEAWVGNANLNITENPFYINGPIHIVN